MPKNMTTATAVKDVVQSNTASGDTGEVSNTPTSSDAQYLSPIKIGGQTLMMNFDTGSSDL